MSARQEGIEPTNKSSDNNDTLNMDPEEILLNLKIISQIKEYEKLNTNEDQLSIDQSHVQFLSRSYYGNCRDKTIKMIQNIVDNALSITDSTLKNDMVDKEKDNYFKEDPSNLLHRFLLQMQNAIKGLENLKVTYKEDVPIQSKLDLINEKLTMRINKINKVLTISV